MKRAFNSLGLLGLSVSFLFGIGVLFFMALLTGWWFLAGLMAALAVLAVGSLCGSVVVARGRDSEPLVRPVLLAALVVFGVFTVAGIVVTVQAFS